ncbi:MAG: diguanylate cyclase [Thermoleophilia bacterium]|nr:diguanylate cyclase [Thermoleophilia bacterium]
MLRFASWIESHVASFKFRLAAFFVLLAMLPLLTAVWAFSEVATSGETRRADARLHRALHNAAVEFGRLVEDAEANAASLAHAKAFRVAAAESNRAALARLYRDREVGRAAFYLDGQVAAGSRPPALGIRRVAEVADERGRWLGYVVVWVPLDGDLVARLARHGGLAPSDSFALLSGRRTVVGPNELASVAVPYAEPRDLELAGGTYRALATTLVDGHPDAQLVALTPRSTIEAQAADLRRRVLLLTAIALCLAAALAHLLGRTIVRSLKELAGAADEVARGNFSSRVPVRGRDEFASLGRAFNDMAANLEAHVEELAWERGRARDAVARFGDALAATHNPLLLVPVILESMVEATGAAGGRLLVDGSEIASAGEPGRDGERLEITLSAGDSEALLLLTPRRTGFSDEARELAYWLASQARTALENATLHKRLEQAAVTDTLTGLPNRRRFEESLDAELTRVERFGGTLALLVADLDDFKQVNDRYGHPAGDDVLRSFADALRENLREVDTPARYGGEEFTVLLPETDLEAAQQVAERIRVAMESRRAADVAGGLTVTASFGVAAFPESPTEAALFAAADEALYRAKADGKNRVAVAGEGVPGERAFVRGDA